MCIRDRNVVYWLFFRIEFLEIIKIDNKKTRISVREDDRLFKEIISFLKLNIIPMDKNEETTNCGSFVNLKKCIIM